MYSKNLNKKTLCYFVTDCVQNDIALCNEKKKLFTHRFFEWHAEDNKQPYYIQFKDRITPHLVVNDDGDETATDVSGKQLLTMAGLFDRQVSEEVCFFN